MISSSPPWLEMLRIHVIGQGHAPTTIEVSGLAEALKGEDTVWIDLSEPTEEEFRSVARHFNWHPLEIEDCQIENLLPKVDDYGDHLFLVLHGIDVQAESVEFDSKELEVFVGSNYLVTHHEERMTAADEMAIRCQRNPVLAARGPSYLLYLLLDSMSGIYLPYLDQIDDRIDGVEKALIERPERPTLQKIYELRRDVIALRRVVNPQIEVMRRLARGEFTVVPEAANIYFRDIYDDLFRITQSTDSYRELLSGALDSYMSSLSNEMNQVMKVLTVFAAILGALTFLAGIWGMNFIFMPELDERWGYPFAIGLMFLAAAALAWFFRRKRWF